MMRRLILALVLSVAAYGAAKAQQLPQYSQYVLNNYLTNPAVGGIESYTDLRMGYRRQWSGLDGAPESFYASVHGSIGNPDRSNSPKARKSNRYGFSSRSSHRKAIAHHGVGAVAQTDKAGLLQTTSLNVSYSYHQPLTRYFTLASGVTGGFSQYSVNVTDAQAFDPNDPYLSGGKLNATKLDLGIGFWLYTPDFYIGVSGMQLLPSGNDFESIKTNAKANGRMQHHYYTTAGLRFQPSKEIAFVPSVMVKMTETSAPAVDFNARLMYAQRIWGGVSYRHTDALAFMAGLNVNHVIDIGYSYDATTSDLNKASAGSHEVVLGLKLNNSRKIICPTWMW